MGNGKRAKQLKNLSNKPPLRKIESEDFIKPHLKYMYKDKIYSGTDLIAFIEKENLSEL